MGSTIASFFSKKFMYYLVSYQGIICSSDNNIIRMMLHSITSPTNSDYIATYNI